MSTETPQKTEKTRADRLLKRRQELMEAMRKDIQALKKIVACTQQKPSKPTA